MKTKVHTKSRESADKFQSSHLMHGLRTELRVNKQRKFTEVQKIRRLSMQTGNRLFAIRRIPLGSYAKNMNAFCMPGILSFDT